MDIQNNTKYYVSHNTVHADTDHSFKGKCVRKVGHIVGLRHYRLDTVIKSLDTIKLPENERNNLYKKFAKKFQVETEMEALIHIEQAKAKALGESSEDPMNALAKEIYSDPAKKERLEKFVKQLPESSTKAQMIQDVLARAAIVTKWNRLNIDMGENFDPFAHYQDIETLVRSRLVYTIIGFQNTTQAGKENHKIVLNEQGLNIKIEGRWRSVSMLRDPAYFTWDASELMFANAHNQDERWNYLSPFGLIPVDRFFHHERNENAPEHCKPLSPVEKLSAEEMTQVVAKAKEFDPNGSNLDQKTCVLQIVSNPRQVFGNSSMTKNANAQFPVHCGIRLILEDGTVYSTGFGSTNYEDQWSSGLNTYFSSINGQPTILDYEEFRVHEGRVTTNIPATEEQAEKILRFLNEAREHSIRFNVARQNCMRLGVICMEKADVAVDIQTTLKSKMKKACPKVTDIPVLATIAKPVVWTEKKVDYIVDKTMPSFAKSCFKFLRKIAFYLPDKVSTFLFNILLLCFGASKASPTHQRENGKETENFKSVVTNVGDLFKDETNMIYDSTKMVQWQLQQHSTIVSSYAGQPSMNIVPNCHDTKLMNNLKSKFKA